MSLSLKKILFILLLLYHSACVFSRNYYVAANGNNTFSGLSAARAWKTLAFAASSDSPVVAGDTVFVQAGNYGAEQVVFKKSGTAARPVVFMGYSGKPGDARAFARPYSMNLDAVHFPVYDGGNRKNGVCFYLQNISHIVIKNFQIKNYKAGLSGLSVHHVQIINLMSLFNGDVDNEYSGYGIHLEDSSSYNTISACVVINASAEAISVRGNYNTIKKSSVFCNENSTANASTDYYILVAGSYNAIQACYAERSGDLHHQGHGIGLKGNCVSNKIDSCTAINCGENFYVRHRGVKNNYFKNCTAYGGGGIVIRDGASFNQFESCIVEQCSSGILFFDTTEDGGAQYCGRNNIIKNCLIKEAYIAINYGDYNQVSSADSNLIVNCTFYASEYLFNCDRPNAGNKLMNCIVYKTHNLSAGANHLNCEYSYCNFYNNTFKAIPGEGHRYTDPDFVNAVQGDFRLKVKSPCNGSGKPLSDRLKKGFVLAHTNNIGAENIKTSKFESPFIIKKNRKK